MDHIYLKHKIRITEIHHAMQEYALEEDPDVRAITNANALQR